MIIDKLNNITSNNKDINFEDSIKSYFNSRLKIGNGFGYGILTKKKNNQIFIQNINEKIKKLEPTKLKEIVNAIRAIKEYNKKREFSQFMFFFAVLSVIAVVLGIIYGIKEIFNALTESEKFTNIDNELEGIKTEFKEFIIDLLLSDDKKNIVNEIEKKLTQYQIKTKYSIDEILKYMNIPTNLYELSDEQIYTFSQITSKNDEEQKEIIYSLAVGRSLYNKLDDETKEKFLNLDGDKQNYIIQKYNKLIIDTLNKNDNLVTSINQSINYNSNIILIYYIITFIILVFFIYKFIKKINLNNNIIILGEIFTYDISNINFSTIQKIIYKN